jgi:hypothetical protein
MADWWSPAGVICERGGSSKELPAVLTMWFSLTALLEVAKSRSAFRFSSSASMSERSQARPERCVGKVEDG